MEPENQTLSLSSQAIQEVFKKQKTNHFKTAQTTAEERIQKILKLKTTCLSRADDLKKALHMDFKKSALEVDLSEIYSTIAEINFTVRNLKKWMKPTRVGNPVLMTGSKSQVYYEPKGVVLIIGPWNYPFSLVIIPLISAIAAGNCVIIKPSELTENTSRFLTEIIRDCFSEDEVAIFEGGSETAQKLLTLPFDHIFFTGSTRVGRIVMEAAAKQLIPVTLELGGKSPAIIHPSAHLPQAASRIVWGKCLNAGQTCVAPDYVLVPEDLKDSFIAEAKKTIESLYGPTEKDRQKSSDLCRIISQPHYERLKKLTQKAVTDGAQIELGGIFDDGEKYVSPTLLSNVHASHAIMEEEIFGPILPILTYKSLDEVYQLIQSKSKPLALYIFSQDKKQIQDTIKKTTAGGTCINATLVHLANPHLPFGGVGQSGVGNYHGYFGFKTFSHERAVLRQGVFDSVRLLYPPYQNYQKKIIDLATRFFT
jgi:aldehyde dehydrogenase (NAD+)